MVLSTRQTLDRFLLRVVDGGFAGVIFLVPLLMGGRHAIGQLALTVLAVAVALAWAVRQSLCGGAAWRPAVATPLILLGVALLGLQIVPLPPWLLARMAPHTADILPLWSANATAPGSLGYWPCISFTPAETRAGLIVFLDYALLFFVAVQRVGHIEDVERLLRWCALSAVLMASFGIVQLLAGNGKFFWFHEAPFTNTFGSAKGSFSNRNHFAQFLALGIGPLIWWLQDAMRRMRGGADVSVRSARGKNASAAARSNVRGAEPATYFLGLALGVVLFAGLLSLSRGGIAAMFLAAAVATAVCYRTASLGRRFLGAVAAAGILIGVSLAIFGLDRVSDRLEDFSSASLERLDRSAARRTIWTAAAQAVPDRLLWGAGVGSFREVYPMYTGFLVNEGIEFTHAENSPLQEAVETGLVGLALTLAAAVLCASWCIGGVGPSTPTRLRVCAAAIAGSLAAITAHAVVDFVWYVPACMAIVAILAACALRVRQLRGQGSGVRGQGSGVRDQGSGSSNHPSSFILHPSSLSSHLSPLSPRRMAWAAAALAVACVGGWMIVEAIGPAVAQTYWDEYLVARHAGQAPDPKDEAATQQRWIAILDGAVQWQPSHVQAHLALAESHRRLFEALQTGSENPMSLANLRDAAMRSRFPSRAALVEWLSRAVGKHWTNLDQSLNHVRSALALCPLEGRAYVYLAELSFLAGADGAARQAYVGQAMRVRPFDGSVLYAAGTEALLAGDQARWLDCMKRAFRSSHLEQQQVIGNLVAGASAENLPPVIAFILREFQPDLESARFLHDLVAGRLRGQPDVNGTRNAPATVSLAALARYRAEKAEGEAPTLDDTRAAKVWFEAEQVRLQLGDETAALRCIGKALQCDPGNYDVHYQCAVCLLRRGMFAEAESHARWCLQRTPDDQAAAGLLREALKGRLDGQRRAAAEGTPLR